MAISLRTVLASWVCVSWLFLPAGAQASPGAPASMGEPIATGNGCPSGTFSAVLSPDHTSLSVLFDNFKASAGGSAHAPREAKAKCNLRIPLTISSGYQAQIVKVDYRGFNDLGSHSASRVTTTLGYDLLWHGWTVPFYRTQHHETFRGPVDDAFELTSSIKNPQWTPCGHSVSLVIDSKIQDVSLSGETAETEIDSIDAVTAPLSLQMKWRKCR